MSQEHPVEIEEDRQLQLDEDARKKKAQAAEDERIDAMVRRSIKTHGA